MSTSVLPHRTARPSATRTAGFGAVVRSEWLKLATLRSTRLVALGVVGSALAAAFVQSIAYIASSTPDVHRPAAQSTAAILELARLAAQLMAAVLAILVVSPEFTTGSIRSSLLAAPRRGQVLAAKTVLVVVAVTSLSVVSAAASYLLSLPLTARVGLAVGPGAPAVLRAARSFVLYEVLVGLFALAVGVLVRHTATAIVLVLGVLVVLPVPLAWLSGPTDLALSDGSFVTAASTVAQLGRHSFSDLGTGILVTAAWLTLPAVLGTLGFLRRDV